MADILKPTACGHCDFGSGTRGMDRCAKCDGAGSVFRVGDKSFANTRDGYEEALETEIERLLTREQELVEGLRPFGEAAAHYEGWPSDIKPWAAVRMTIGDLRRARALAAQIGEKP